MSGLDFLKKITVQQNATVITPAARTKTAAAKNPENADLRILKNGAVYPSVKLVTVCDLQYRAKDSVEKGNGFDVFSSKDFLNTKGNSDHCMFIAMVPKNAKFGKVDLFAQTSYEADGTSKSDVLTQGAVTAGKELLLMIEDVYGISIGDKPFIDLKVITTSPFTTDDKIYYVPKKVSRGEAKGQTDLVRRENLTLYPLVPVSMLEEEAASEAEANVAEETMKKAVKPGKKDKVEAEVEPPLSDIEAETGDKPEDAATLPAGILEDEETADVNLNTEVDDTLEV